MRKRLVVVGVLASSALAMAGAKFQFPVEVIDLGGGHKQVRGSIGSSRNASDQSELQVSSGEGFAMCFGRTASGTSALCVASSAEQIALLRSVNGDSFVSCGVGPGGACDFITIENASFDEPKAP